MGNIMGGQVYINDVDIWEEYGAFLYEERKGGRENLKSLFAPSKAKKNVAVSASENNGESYSSVLLGTSEARDVTLHFAIYADTKAEFLKRYSAFLSMLKKGDGGWLDFRFPYLEMELRMFYLECTDYSPLTYLWKEGKQASHFKIKFREPVPTF